ncbi:transposase-like protein [Paraburkholderia sp. JPY158]|uniref:Transposase-like protein n=1 Tax=Paraburkholderia atlantica TaxID=2654982 RepID=A0A7W8QHD0_PARAM|nr:transposase-like protein [Paraburkholderia atlantica]
MKKRKSHYHGHRFPTIVISCAVQYFRFSLSLRDIEELLLERGVVVTTKQSVAGATSSALNSPSVQRRRGASGATHGIWMRCS